MVIKNMGVSALLCALLLLLGCVGNDRMFTIAQDVSGKLSSVIYGGNDILKVASPIVMSKEDLQVSFKVRNSNLNFDSDNVVIEVGMIPEGLWGIDRYSIVSTPFQAIFVSSPEAQCISNVNNVWDTRANLGKNETFEHTVTVVAPNLQTRMDQTGHKMFTGTEDSYIIYLIAAEHCWAEGVETSAKLLDVLLVDLKCSGNDQCSNGNICSIPNGASLGECVPV